MKYLCSAVYKILSWNDDNNFTTVTLTLDPLISRLIEVFYSSYLKFLWWVNRMMRENEFYIVWPLWPWHHKPANKRRLIFKQTNSSVKIQSLYNKSFLRHWAEKNFKLSNPVTLILDPLTPKSKVSITNKI